MTNSVAKTITSVTLTAGNWLCNGATYFSGGAAITGVIGGLSTATNTLPAVPYYYFLGNSGASAGGGPVPAQLFSGAQTIYLVGEVVFTSTAPTAVGSLVCVHLP
jgi:hypothetical protein